MTRDEKYAWMRQRQEAKKAAQRGPKPGSHQDRALIKERKFAWMRKLQQKKADAKQAAKERREKERAKEKAAMELARVEAQRNRQNIRCAIEANAVVDQAGAVTGFTWGTPLAPRTRDQVKRACAWHKRRKNDATRIKCACGDCEVCQRRARQTEKVRRWRAAKKEAA